MVGLMLLLAGVQGLVSSAPLNQTKYDDAILPAPLPGQLEDVDVCIDPEFRCKWLSGDNLILDSVPDSEKPRHLEIAATLLITDYHHQTGAEIIQLMARNMPSELFTQMAANCRVGLFTDVDKTTIFPEYSHMRDTPQCAGRCDNECAVTCTGDGRKYDDLAGVGGVRGTCVDNNYMCTPKDPYRKIDNILVHEFAHTVHQYALPYVPGDWWNRIYYAWQNARQQAIWDVNSYAMVNHLEYFAEGTGVFFNVNHHVSTGGMNSCGKTSGYCDCPEDAREWLSFKDLALYQALVYTYTNGYGAAKGDLHICMTEPNNGDCGVR